MYIYAPKTGKPIFPYSIQQLRKDQNVSIRSTATDEQLAKFNVYRVTAETTDFTKQNAPQPAYEGGQWVLKSQDRDIKTVKKELRAKINKLRYARIYQESIPYTFPGDTEPDGIQMRDERDRQNVQDHILESVVLFSEGSTDTLTFMPASNKPKTMTPAQGVQMGKYLKARGNRIMEHSWLLKSQVQAAQSLEDIKSINIQAGWPE